MTSLFHQASEEDSTICKDTNDNFNSHHCKNALYIRGKKIRPKCNEVLKKKLKKYKLRQDGREDQDVLYVSGILESSLIIKSPSEGKSSIEVEIEQQRPINYLSKMGRKKLTESVNKKSDKKKENGSDGVQSSPTTEEKKQTNAFQVLMESRNKSLCNNSPGKDKPVNDDVEQELLDKKNNKAKRNLILQKMAENKGSLKNKEIEENQEKYIKKKMEKRAELLKNMISNIEPKTPKVCNEKNDSKLLHGRKPLNNLKTEKNEKHSNKPVKSLQLVNMFTEIEKKDSPEKVLISKEDEEFLNKLSPLKKKESMLSYFKKVEKEPDCTYTDNENNVIKVKIGTKTKKKIKKKKLSLNKGSSDMNLVEVSRKDTVKLDQDVTNNEKLDSKELKAAKIEDITSEKRKRKREFKSHDNGAVSSSNILVTKDDTRAKRSIKRPVKYNDEAGLSSSDEELHIFTPKKIKHSDNKNHADKTLIVDITSDNEEKSSTLKEPVTEKTEKKKSKEKENKPVKLAPIFSSKSPLDTASIEARQKFLLSGVPEKLKKVTAKQVNKNTMSNYFCKVVHIQQLNETDIVQSPSMQFILKDFEVSVNQRDTQDYRNKSFKPLLNMDTSQEAFSLSSKHTNAQVVLKKLKEQYPRFPVKRTYRLLRGKKNGDYKEANNYLDLDNSVEILNASIDNQNHNPEQLSWSDKYKPLAASHIIGNFQSVKELRKWLVSWTENNMKTKAVNGNGSDSSDYYQSDGDSKDSVKSSKNLLVLSGPVGSGKTSSVYAIAAELAIKVIEVNASSKRTGKIMLQDLQEATQSHKVNRQASSNENSQNSQKSEIIDIPLQITSNPAKKRGRPKKNPETTTPIKSVVKKTMFKEKTDSLSGSQDVTRTCMSLILIDDADIVFDQDDGFCSAIVQLVQSSKRPVILITSSLSCPHLQRFLQSSKQLKMNPLQPNILGTWLDIMCFADSGMCWPGVGSKVLNLFNGDVRKTINCLQFYCGSQQQASGQEELYTQNTESQVDDENSNMSWADCDEEDRNPPEEPKEISESSKIFMRQQLHFMHNSTDLFNIWWSVPKIMAKPKSLQKKNYGVEKPSKSLELISQVLDSISLCDSYGDKHFQNKCNVTSDPWFVEESHSVSELENLDIYDRHYSMRAEIARELTNSSISIALTAFGCEEIIDLDIPGMSQQGQRNRIVSHHINLTKHLSLQAVLDRKSLALDYWSSCRTICRIEKSKTDTKSKRNNRFCHYLKSLNVPCKNDLFDKLANSLCPSEVNIDTTLS